MRLLTVPLWVVLIVGAGAGCAWAVAVAFRWVALPGWRARDVSS